MKIKSLFITCFMLSLLLGCKNDKSPSKKSGKDIGALHISKEKPQPGEALNVQFRADSTQVDTTFSAYYYTLVNNHIYARDLKMRDSSGVWKAQVSIPDSATAIGFNFNKNGAIDKKTKSFVQPLFDEDGKLKSGSQFGKAAFHLNFDEQTGQNTSVDSILNWMQADMKTPQSRKAFNADYADYLHLNGEESPYVKKQLKTYAKNDSLSEKDYETMVKFYGMLNRDKEADSVRQIAAKKYPKGQAAQQKFAKKFSEAKTWKNKKQIFQDYEKTIGKTGKYKDYMLNNLAQHALKTGDFEKFRTYSAQASNQNRVAATYNNMAWNMAQRGEDLDKAAKISKEAVELMSPSSNTDKFEDWTQSEYNNYLERVSGMYRDTYAYILFKLGKTGEALTQQAQAVGEGTSPDVNERYLKYLLADDKPKKAEAKARQFIKQDQANAKIKDYFKTAYRENKGSAEGYEENLAKLEKQARKKAMASLKKAMLNKKAPNFNLTDKAGNAVKLADLKGKTVVLDFWATWCGPCRKSFPGMVKAVNFYKDNPEVKFYFVNTFQREGAKARHKKVADFMKKNDYPFDVLFDENEHNNFKTASAYGITGIPTKIIIGPNGQWKFTKVGFGGSNEKLLEEVKMMVKLAQKS